MATKIGRPEIDFKWDVLNAVLQYGASLVDCSEFCDCSEDTIQNRIKDAYGMTFTEYRNKKMARTRMAIVKKQVDKALAGDNTMLIWTGKNLCNQSDKFSEPTNDAPDETIPLSYNIAGNKYVKNATIEVQNEDESSTQSVTILDDPRD